MFKVVKKSALVEEYRRIKSKYPKHILLMKVGDFYEAFDADAKTLADRFNVTITHRAGTPVIGIPYHAVQTYIVKLMKTGIKVALCEWVRGNSGEIEPDLFISCDN